MGYKTVRAAVRHYLEGANIPAITRWENDAPWYLDGANWKLAPGQQYGAMAFPHIDSSMESRVALPAVTGMKAVRYEVSILFQYQYIIPTRLNGLEEDDWVVGVDSIIDGLKERMRADPALGVGSPVVGPDGTVLEAAQDPNDLEVLMDLPAYDPNGGRLYLLGRLTTHVTEIVIG